MIAIVNTVSSKNKRSRFSFLPYRTVKDIVGTEPVTIYSLATGYRPFFRVLIKSLLKKQPHLIFSEELRADQKPVSPCFFLRINEILPLIYQNKPQKIAILCRTEDPRLLSLLNAVSPFALSVSLVTKDSPFTEKICEDALQELGLTVNRRTISELFDPDLIFFLSGEFMFSSLRQGYFINLSEQEIDVNLPTLSALTNDEISAFLSRHPDIQINPTRLLSEKMSVTGLIWKYS